MASVRDNKSQSRFELDVDGGVAFASYRLTPNAVIIITHTETPRTLRAAVSPRDWWKVRSH